MTGTKTIARQAQGLAATFRRSPPTKAFQRGTKLARVSARVPERCVRSYSAAQVEVPPLEEGSVAYEKQDYAVVELGGSQVIVEVGGVYDTNRLDAEPGSTIKLNRVLLVKNQGDNDLRLGKPYVENATVEAEVVQHKKAKKVVVFKMQPKKHTRSKVGHRQHQTTIKVTKISV
ncbi:ribosomal protein L21 [Chloropicon primus]|nr:ribosomal protein L21 [Chloropicon primus]UPR02289.1 ribosomal protein L21 [Chloropicon primus]|eukprot:QDZ23075.1 ribosomal protein L21 [Chloropicon primus]